MPLAALLLPGVALNAQLNVDDKMRDDNFEDYGSPPNATCIVGDDKSRSHDTADDESGAEQDPSETREFKFALAEVKAADEHKTEEESDSSLTGRQSNTVSITLVATEQQTNSE